MHHLRLFLRQSFRLWRLQIAPSEQIKPRVLIIADSRSRVRHGPLAAGHWLMHALPAVVFEHVSQDRVHIAIVFLNDLSLIIPAARRLIRRGIDVLVWQFFQQDKFAQFLHTLQILLREHGYQGCDGHSLPQNHSFHVEFPAELRLRDL